jgi:hypothetical protein
MNVTTARTYVRQFARNGTDTGTYTNADVDRAIITVGEDFVAHTRSTLRRDSLALAPGDYNLPAFAGALANFTADRLVRAYIDDQQELSIVDFATIVDSRRNNDISGAPTAIGLEVPGPNIGAGLGQVWPRPDGLYTLYLVWFEPFTTWTEGVVDGSGITINLREDLLRPILIHGATAMLQHTEKQHAFGSRSWQLYLAFRDSMRAAGNLGPRELRREL